MGATPRHARAAEKQTLDRVFALFPRLSERRRQAAGTLSGGEQQMLAIGRCLMGQPRLIMFDEPSLGLAPTIVQEVFRIVRRLNEEGLTILLVEQNVMASLKIAHRGYVLENGRIELSGPGRDAFEQRSRAPGLSRPLAAVDGRGHRPAILPASGTDRCRVRRGFGPGRPGHARRRNARPPRQSEPWGGISDESSRHVEGRRRRRRPRSGAAPGVGPGHLCARRRRAGAPMH